MTHTLSVEYNTEEIGSIKPRESLFHLKFGVQALKTYCYCIPIAVDYTHYRLINNLNSFSAESKSIKVT